MQFPVGIPASEWLITSVNTFEGMKVIFFRPAFFRWVFFERITQQILGGFLVFFLILGLVKKQKSLLLPIIGLSALIYLLVFQGGNVQHEYYQFIILPALAIFIGSGIGFLFKNGAIFPYRLFNFIITGLLIFASIAFSFYQVRGNYHLNEHVLTTAKIIKTITPTDALIVTDKVGDTTLLYLSDRKGFPATTHPLEELQAMGMDYFVTDKKEVAADNRNQYELVFESDDIYLFKL